MARTANCRTLDAAGESVHVEEMASAGPAPGTVAVLRYDVVEYLNGHGEVFLRIDGRLEEIADLLRSDDDED